MKAQSIPVKKIPKVCVLGPECTGKTALSKALAEHYKTDWVAEYARAYLGKLGRPYDQPDLLKIAHGQLRMEGEWIRDANNLLICDTNLIVIKIWSEVKFGSVDPDILEKMAESSYDLYLLTYIDVPWENDPLREHPGRREELYQLYLSELKKLPTPFVEVKGSLEQRKKSAIEAIQKYLKL
jgi:NadR type nicotinamide-nucleotide adenylyltransferase